MSAFQGMLNKEHVRLRFVGFWPSERQETWTEVSSSVCYECLVLTGSFLEAKKAGPHFL